MTRTIGWMQRRMAHEIGDAQLGRRATRSGTAEPIATEIAVDGIDEFLDVFVAARGERIDGPVETIHVHVTDGDGEWLLTVGEGSTSLARDPRQGRRRRPRPGLGSRPAGPVVATDAPTGVEIIGDAQPCSIASLAAATMAEVTTYRPGQVAELLGVSADTVRRWCDEGRLVTKRSAGGHRTIDGAALARYLRQTEQAYEPDGPGRPVGPQPVHRHRHVGASATS